MDRPEIEPAKAAELLSEFLNFYGRPSFGSPSKRDIDVQVFSMLRKLAWVTESNSLFEIADSLKVTRGKARSLLFDFDVRRTDEERGSAVTLIKNALIGLSPTKDGDYFVFEVESPYTQAILRERVRKIGHVSDTSFNTSLVRMSSSAIIDLIDDVLTLDEKKAVKKALRKAGSKAESFRDVISDALKSIPKKLTGGAVTGVGSWGAKEAAPYMKSLLFPGDPSFPEPGMIWNDSFGNA
jgi:hypothetical protein